MSTYRVFYVTRDSVVPTNFSAWPSAARIFVSRRGARFAVQHLKTKHIWRLYDFDKLGPMYTRTQNANIMRGTMRMPPVSFWETYAEFETALAAALLQL